MRTYKQLTREQRYQIYALKKANHNQSFIADMLEVDRSTISRELKRNKGLKGYRPKQAHKKTQDRHECKVKFTKFNEELINFITHELHEFDSSPKQIAGRYTRQGDRSISHEAIYLYLLRDKVAGGQLYKSLRHKSKSHRKRYGVKDRRGGLKNRVSIEERPTIVDEKIRIGDFEGDLIIGKNHKQALVTLVDRHSKLTLVKKIANKKAATVSQAIIKMLKPYQAYLKTLTLDNGKEFSYHQEISKELDLDIYFCHPYCSYERGLSEHTNGLLRQYHPKGSSFDMIDDTITAQDEYKLNNRPREALDFRTPLEVFSAKMLLEV